MNPNAQNLVEIAASTVIIYLYLIIAIRTLSRKQLGQLSVLDLLIVILLGSAVETAMVHGSTSLRAGLVSAAALFACNYIISRAIRKNKRFGRFCGSGPVLLVHDGRFVEEHLKRVGLTKEDVMHALRQREHADLTNVRFAVLEPDGQVNVVPRSIDLD